MGYQQGWSHIGQGGHLVTVGGELWKSWNRSCCQNAAPRDSVRLLSWALHSWDEHGSSTATSKSCSVYRSHHWRRHDNIDWTSSHKFASNSWERCHISTGNHCHRFRHLQSSPLSASDETWASCAQRCEQCKYSVHVEDEADRQLEKKKV